MTPEEAEQDDVRRLLAALDDPAPAMPEEVAQRLDDVLAGLVAERAGTTPGHGSAAVTDLSERRAARWPRLLVAAAAVTVLGLGIGNVMSGTESVQSSDEAASDEDGDAGDASAQDQAAPEAAGPDTASKREDKDEDREAAAAAKSQQDTGRIAVPRLRSDSLNTDAQRVSDSPVLAGIPGGLLGGLSAEARGEIRGCVAPATGRGDELIVVRLDGEPATMVLRAPENGRRAAEVYACDHAGPPLASTRVDTR
ncbi:MAG TPA: hypothetical protein VFD59_10975 [Nocardioidaceae bacterium]|nr:hypothetical protein [Nocardioidaceae bacterium]